MVEQEGNVVGRLLSAESEDEVYRWGVALLGEAFRSPASIYSTKPDGKLEIRGTTASSVMDADRSIPLSDRIRRQTGGLEQSVRIDDCVDRRSAGGGERSSGTYRSALLVPITDWGMLIVADEAPDVFDERDLEVAELIARVLETKLGDPDHRSGSSLEDDRLELIASTLSHDLPNPLIVARAYVDEAVESGEVEGLEKVRLAIDRIEEITSGLETFARTGRTVTDLERVELGDVAEDCWDLVDAPEASLVIADSRVFLADERRLRQLFENLFSNAVEHGGSEVTVRVGALGDRAGFFVEDDGPGVPGDEREVVFEHGYSGAEGRSGFGLSIVKGIVDAHGWAIRVVDRDPSGARFEISGVASADP